MRWLNVFVILATFLSYLSPYFSPENYWLFSVFGVAFPWFLLTNILFVIFWAILKKPYFLFSLGCIIMGWHHVESIFGFDTTTHQINHKPIKIMSYNMHNLVYLSSAKGTIKTQRINEFNTWLKKQSPDIFCAQERNISPQKGLESFLYEHGGRPARATIFSNIPFLKTGTIEYKNFGAPAVWADIKIDDDQIVRVYSIHLHSNHIDPNTIDQVAQGKIQKKETWMDIKGMIGKYKRFAAIRVRQAAVIAKHISTSPYPVILGGDMNEPSLSYAYHLLSQNLNDAFIEQGKGIGTTYAGKIPFLRIDHILIDERLKIHYHETFHKPFSDHYPVVCTVSF